MTEVVCGMVTNTSHMGWWGDEPLKQFAFQKHTPNFHSDFPVCTTGLLQRFLQKDKPVFQTQLVESYHFKKSLAQSLQETQISDFHSQSV